MTKRTKTQQDQNQWQQQRDERMSDLMRQLEAGVQAIQTSEELTDKPSVVVESCDKALVITRIERSRRVFRVSVRLLLTGLVGRRVG